MRKWGGASHIGNRGNREEYDRKEELANEMGVTQEEDNDKLKAIVLA